MNNDDDLLEVYDEKETTARTTEKSPSPINWIGAFLVLGFLLVIGMIFFKKPSNRFLDRDVVLMRQVELLNVLKTSNDKQEIQQVVNEYDSLALVLDKIDNH